MPRQVTHPSSGPFAKTERRQWKFHVGHFATHFEVLLSSKPSLVGCEMGRIVVALMISAALGLTVYFGVAAWKASPDSDITGKISIPSHFE